MPRRSPGGLRSTRPKKFRLLKTAANSYSLARLATAFMVSAALVACQLIPTKPDALFILYRDNMKAENLSEARGLLSDDSRELALKLAAAHGLRQPPENLALLNILDPVAAPAIAGIDERTATLQVRTLKGGVRSIQLVRADADSPWKIDIKDELGALQTFLQARGALDMIREQAGEYASSLKEFNSQLDRMEVAEPAPAVAPPPQKPSPRGKKTVKKPAPRRPAKPRKQSE